MENKEPKKRQTYNEWQIDNGLRRSGRTTRLADQLVQEFFNTGVAWCIDHYSGNHKEMNVRLHRIVFDRLVNEHQISTSGKNKVRTSAADSLIIDPANPKHEATLFEIQKVMNEYKKLPI